MLEVPIQNRWGEVISSFLIDEEDVYVTQYNWRISRDGYVYRKKNGKTILLHRALFNDTDIQGKVIDHINGVTTDNRRCNLRVCTPAENSRNAGISKSNTSGITGVSWRKDRQKWRSHIRFEGKFYALGHYDNLEDAIKARKEAEVKYFGEFRRKD